MAPFKAQKTLRNYHLATGRVLPGSEDLEASLNVPNIEEFKEPYIETLRDLYLIASNQTRRRPWAEMYFDALDYLGAHYCAKFPPRARRRD